MNVSCGSCPAKYAVPDEKVRGRKVRITCKRCGAPIIVDGTAADGAPKVASVAPAKAAEPAAAGRPAVAVPSLGGGDAPLAGRAMKRTMLGIPGPAADAAPAPPAAAAVQAPLPRAASTAQPAKASSAGWVAPASARAAPAAARDAKPQADAGQSSTNFAKRTMVGGMTAPLPRVQPPPEPAPPPPVEWTVAVTDEHHVPMTIPQIVDAYAAGRIDAETFIWKEGMPDWLMPFEIPEIESALRSKGFRPSKLVEPGRDLSGYGDDAYDKPTTVSEPPPFDAGDAGGMWREPGRWNEPGSPFGNEQGTFEDAERDLPKFGPPSGDAVSFDDVTVAMRAPEAEKLLREAADESGTRMVGEADSESKFKPVDPFDNRLDLPSADPTDATVRYDKSTAPELAELPLVGALPAEVLKPEQRAPKPAQRAERAVPRAATRKPADEKKSVDIFAKAAASAEAPAPPDELSEADKAQQARMTGARNESSVLFSLDALMKTDKAAPKPAAPSKKEEDVLLGAGAVPAMQFGTALAAPDFSAPVAEPPPSARPRAAASVAADLPEARSSGGGWLWAAIVLLVVAGAATAAWLLKPPWLMKYLPGAAPAAEPTTATEPAPGPTASQPEEPAPSLAAATAAVTPSAAVPAASASAAASADPAAAKAPAPAERKPAAPAPAEKKAAAAPEAAPAAPAPASNLPPFDKEAAAAALSSAAASAGSCKQPDGPTGAGRATVTFAPSGRATNATVSGDLAGTAVGGCIARLFRQARVPPFSGDPITVAKGFNVQ